MRENSFTFAPQTRFNTTIKDMKISHFLLLALAATSIIARADDRQDDYRSSHQALTCGASLNAYGSDPGYTLGLSYAYYPIQFVGISAGIGFQSWGISGNTSSEINIDNDIYVADNDDLDKKSTLIFTLAPTLRTPSVRVGRGEDVRLFMECAPGLMLTPFANERITYASQRVEGQPGKWVQRIDQAKNSNGQWAAWMVRPSVNLSVDKGIIGLGCRFSNLDPYSSRRHLSFKGRKLPNSYPHHKLTAEIFLTLTATI